MIATARSVAILTVAVAGLVGALACPNLTNAGVPVAIGTNSIGTNPDEIPTLAPLVAKIAPSLGTPARGHHRLHSQSPFHPPKQPKFIR